MAHSEVVEKKCIYDKMRAVRGVGCIEKLIDLDVRIEYSSASVYRDTRELSRMFCASVLITFLPHGVYRHG